MVSLSSLRALTGLDTRSLVRSALRRTGGLDGHPMRPAAVRVERTRSQRRGGGTAEQTAVTLWFGDGPDLPTPVPARGTWRAAAGLGATLLGAVALAAASAVVAQREEERRLAGARTVRALAPPAARGGESPGGAASGSAGER